MRKALIIGIDHYRSCDRLTGCVADALGLKNVLERHADGTLNFITPRVMLGTTNGDLITKAQIKEAVRELFQDASEIALFYFSGHGHVDDTGGFLCAGDAET